MATVPDNKASFVDRKGQISEILDLLPKQVVYDLRDIVLVSNQSEQWRLG